MSSASGGKETKAIEWEEEQQVRTFPSLTCSSWFGGAGEREEGRRRMIEKQASKQASSPKLLGGGIDRNRIYAPSIESKELQLTNKTSSY